MAVVMPARSRCMRVLHNSNDAALLLFHLGSTAHLQ